MQNAHNTLLQYLISKDLLYTDDEDFAEQSTMTNMVNVMIDKDRKTDAIFSKKDATYSKMKDRLKDAIEEKDQKYGRLLKIINAACNTCNTECEAKCNEEIRNTIQYELERSGDA